MKLKDFLMICDCSDCIFGIYIADKEEPIEEIERPKNRNELEEFYNGVVTSIHPYNDNTIAVMVCID